MAKKSKKAKAPVVEEIEDDLELEELEDDEEETAPAKSKRRDDDVEFGVSDLCAYVKEKTGKEYSTRDMRTLLRKMAREKQARVNREVIPGNRARYNWEGGPDNPEVKRIVKAVAGGEIEKGKQEALARLKEQKAKQLASEEGAPKGKKGKKGKKAKPAPVEDDDEDLTFDEDDE